MLGSLLSKLVMLLLFVFMLLLGFSNQLWLSLSFLGLQSPSLPLYLWLLLAWVFGMLSYWLLQCLSPNT